MKSKLIIHINNYQDTKEIIINGISSAINSYNEIKDLLLQKNNFYLSLMVEVTPIISLRVGMIDRDMEDINSYLELINFGFKLSKIKYVLTTKHCPEGKIYIYRNLLTIFFEINHIHKNERDMWLRRYKRKDVVIFFLKNFVDLKYDLDHNNNIGKVMLY